MVFFCGASTALVLREAFGLSELETLLVHSKRAQRFNGYTQQCVAIIERRVAQLDDPGAAIFAVC